MIPPPSGVVAYGVPCVRARLHRVRAAHARAAGAAGHRRDATGSGADGQRIRLLPAARLPRMGRRRVGGFRRHRGRPARACAHRCRRRLPACIRRDRRPTRFRRPRGDARVRDARHHRQDGPRRRRGRQRHPGRHQEGQAPARAGRRLRAGAGADLRPGADPGGAGLQGRRGRDLVRGLARAGAHRARRGAARQDPRRDRRAAARRGRRQAAAAARRQPQMHQVLARRHLSARRGHLLPRRACAAPAQPGRRQRAAALRAGAGRAGEQVGRGAPDRDRGRGEAQAQDRGGDRRSLRARPARAGRADHAGAGRAAARGDSGDLCLPRRLGARAHGVDRPSQRRDPHRAVAGRLRRAALARLCAQSRGGEDPQQPRVSAA
jgi:hypothetical protein